jgi:hypothetical protein
MGKCNIWYTARFSTSPNSLCYIYINDLPDTVESDSYLFADDTKIFRIIKGEDDKEILQDDLTKLELE